MTKGLGFPSQKVFKEKVLLDLVENAKFLYVLPRLFKCFFVITTFHL